MPAAWRARAPSAHIFVVVPFGKPFRLMSTDAFPRTICCCGPADQAGTLRVSEQIKIHILFFAMLREIIIWARLFPEFEISFGGCRHPASVRAKIST